MIKPEYVELLVSLRANETRHSGRDLLTHLRNTHDLLEAWGCPDDVCAAGLFHSVYGTNSFKHQSCPLDFRPNIAKLIGREAEFLAYLFCVLDRPAALFTLRDHERRRELLQIETANLIEQGIGNKWLIRLRKCDIGDEAKAAIDAQLRKGAP